MQASQDPDTSYRRIHVIPTKIGSKGRFTGCAITTNDAGKVGTVPWANLLLQNTLMTESAFCSWSTHGRETRPI